MVLTRIKSRVILHAHRRAAAALGLSLACLLLGGSAAQAGLSVGVTDMGGGIVPLATPEAPVPTRLSVTFSGSPTAPVAITAGVTAVTLHAGAGFQLGTSATAPSCAVNVTAIDPGSQCPAGSLVGSGSLSVLIGGQQEQMSLNLYNAPGGQQLSVLVNGTTPYRVQAVLNGALDSSRTTLTLPWAAALTEPQPGVFTRVVGFTFSLSEPPTSTWVQAIGCPVLANEHDRGWEFAAAITGSDGSNSEAATAAPCRGAPIVTTGVADMTTTTTTRLIGTVDANATVFKGGLIDSVFFAFEYGGTSSYGLKTVPASRQVAFGPAVVAMMVSGLKPGTTYHYRLLAGLAGSAFDVATYGGADLTFTTAKVPPPSLSRSGPPKVRANTGGFLVNTGLLSVCPALGPRCTAKLVATVALAGTAAGAGRHRAVVGTATTTLMPGTSAKLAFALNKGGAARLRKLKQFTIALATTLQAGSGAPITTARRLRISLPRRGGRVLPH